jgi:hypothetical protein
MEKMFILKPSSNNAPECKRYTKTSEKMFNSETFVLIKILEK